MDVFEVAIGISLIYFVMRVFTVIYLKAHGYEVYLFRGKVKHLKDILKVSKKYSNPFIRILHYINYYFLYFFPVFAIIILIYFISSGPSSNYYNCENLEYFKNKQYSGKVIRKYIDKENHAIETITIQNGDSIFETEDLIYFNDTVFKQIQTGDSLFKENNSELLSVKRDTIFYNYRTTLNCNFEEYKKEIEKLKKRRSHI